MREPTEILHTCVALVMLAPILVFYFVIASDVFGQQPTERYVLVAPSAITQFCSAYAKDKP